MGKQLLYIDQAISYIDQSLYINKDEVEINFSTFFNKSYSTNIITYREDDILKTRKKEFIVLIKDDVIDKVDSILKEIIKFIIKSIVKGENIVVPNYEDKINLIVSTFKNYYQDIATDFDFQDKLKESDSKFFSEIIQFRLVEVLENVLKKVNEFVLNNKVNIATTFYDYISISQRSFISMSSISKDNRDCIENLSLVLVVNKLDRYLNEEEVYLHELFKVKYLLDSKKDKNYIVIPILQIKIRFLIQKWILRRKKNIAKNKTQLLSTALFIDNKIIDLKDAEYFETEEASNLELVQWLVDIKNHYNFIINNEPPKLKYLENNDFDKLSLGQIRQIIKYLRTHKKVNELKSIIEKLETKVNNNENKEQFAINLIYAQNCLLSVVVKNDSSRKEIDEVYQNIVKNQEEYKIINFFAKLKILEIDVKDKLKEIKKLETGNYSSDSNLSIKFSDIEILEQRMSELQELFNKSCNYNSFLYSLSYEESCINTDSQEVDKVYYYSSIFLPLAYGDNKNKIENIGKDLQKIKSLALSIDLIKHGLNDIEDVRKGLENNSKKMIETITIFSAVISFIVGSVGVYKFIDSFLQAIIFILVFGLSISIFVFLVFLSTKGLERIKQFGYEIIGIYTVLLLILASLFYLSNNKNLEFNIKQKHLYYKSLDSIKNIYKEDFINNKLEIQSLNEKYKKDFDELKKKFSKETDSVLKK